MAISSVIRKASSTVVSLPFRAVLSPRILYGSVTNAANSQVKRDSPFIAHNFSSDATNQQDRKLIEVLKSEIQSAKLLDFDKIRPTIPPQYPFKIEDTPGKEDLHLERKFDGEEVHLFIHPPCIPEEDDDGSDNNGGGGGPQLHLRVDILISKSSRKALKMLDLRVAMSAHDMDILTIRVGELSDPRTGYQEYGPYLVDVERETDLHGALRSYIEERGITVTNVGFWYDYMVWKGKRDSVLALEKVKKFEEK